MVVDGDAKVIKKYWDAETEMFIEINMPVRDHVFFRLLQEIKAARTKRK